MTSNGGTIQRTMFQEAGMIAIVLVMIANAWMLIANMNVLTGYVDRMKTISAELDKRGPVIQGTAETANENRKYIIEVQKAAAVNHEEILKNRQETLVNRKKGDDILELLKKLEQRLDKHDKDTK